MAIKFTEMISLLQEKRRNAEQNKEKDNVIEYVKLISDSDRPNVFMTFISVPKLGLNPMNKYDTPTGIYSYPIADYHSKITRSNSLLSIPYQGNLPYVYFFKPKESSVILDSDTFTSANLDDYKKKIENYIRSNKSIKSLYSNSEIRENIKLKISHLRKLKSSLTTNLKKREKSIDILNKKRPLYGKESLFSELEKLRQEANELGKTAFDKVYTKGSSSPNREFLKIYKHYYFFAKLIDFIKKLESVDMNSLTFISGFSEISGSNKTFTSIKDILKILDDSEIPEIVRFNQKLKSEIENIILKQEKIIQAKNINLSQRFDLQNALEIVNTELNRIDSLPEKERNKKSNIALRKKYAEFNKTLQELKIRFSDFKKFSFDEYKKEIKNLIKNIEIQIKHYKVKIKELDEVGYFYYYSKKYPWKFGIDDEQTMENLLKVFEGESDKFAKKLHTQNSLAKLWGYTFHVSKFLSAFSNGLFVNIWNRLFVNVLGVHGVVDHGTGFIHKNEPMQAVFFDVRSLRPLKMMKNQITYKKEKLVDVMDYSDVYTQFTYYVCYNVLVEKDINKIKKFLKEKIFKNEIDFSPIFYNSEMFKNFLNLVFSNMTHELSHNVFKLKVTSDMLRYIEHIENEVQDNWIKTFLARKNNFTIEFKNKYGRYYEDKLSEFLKFLSQTKEEIKAKDEN